MSGIIILWTLLSVVVGVYANSKGRSGIGFALLSLITSPLIGLIVAWLVSADNATVEQNTLVKGDLRKCPCCAELVKFEAKICKHCQSNLPKADVPNRATFEKKRCPNCTKLVNSDDKVCTHCETALVTSK